MCWYSVSVIGAFLSEGSFGICLRNADSPLRSWSHVKRLTEAAKSEHEWLSVWRQCPQGLWLWRDHVLQTWLLLVPGGHFQGKELWTLWTTLKISITGLCVYVLKRIQFDCFERYQHLGFSLIPNLPQIYLDCVLYVCILHVRSCSLLVTLSAIQFLFCAYCWSSSVKLYILTLHYSKQYLCVYSRA